MARTRKIARPAITLKVKQVCGSWQWRVVTDHNGETVDYGDGFVTKDAALTDGLAAFQTIRSA